MISPPPSARPAEKALARFVTWRRVLAAGVVLLLLAAAIFLFLALFSAPILEAEKIRTLIASRIGQKVEGTAGLLPFRAGPLSVVSPGLVVTADPPRALTELRASHIAARVSLIELWRGKWRIDRLNADHLQVAYGAAAAKTIDRSEFPAPEMVPAATSESLMSVDVRQVAIDRTDLTWADPEKDGGKFRDVQTFFRPDGKNLVVEGNGGTFRQAKFPELAVVSFKLFYEKPTLRIDQSRLTLGHGSAVEVRGQFRFEDEASLDLALTLTRCPIGPFLQSESARDKLEGTFHGDAHLQKQMGDAASLRAEGKLAIDRLLVKNVPALAKAAAFTGKRELAPLRVDELSGEYRWEGGELSVRHLRAEAQHLLAVRGQFTFEAGKIAGTFDLGVAPDIAAKFPGAREEVFTREEGGYLWTAVKISGPLEHPQDDLKPRLMQALQKHFLGGLLEPLLKPAQGAREIIGLLFPE